MKAFTLATIAALAGLVDAAPQRGSEPVQLHFGGATTGYDVSIYVGHQFSFSNSLSIDYILITSASTDIVCRSRGVHRAITTVTTGKPATVVPPQAQEWMLCEPV